MRVLSFLLLFALLAPVALPAQDAPADGAELRQWYDSLTPERKKELRHRARVYKRMGKEQQEKAREAAKEGKPIFTPEQRTHLESLRTMNKLQRLRLFTLANELQHLRRQRGEAVRKLLDKDGPERVRELHRMIRMRRAQEFRRTLSPEQQKELDGLSDRERIQRLLKLYEEETKSRRERLEQAFPAVGETRRRARAGDADAREELKRQLADLWTLDLMLQRLDAETRERMFPELAKVSIEDAGDLLRTELRKQWQRDGRERRRNGPPHRGADRRPDDRPRGPDRRPDDRRER
jgi:hypothetical protein